MTASARRLAVALPWSLVAAHAFVAGLFLRYGGQVKDFGWTATVRAGGREVATVDPRGPASGLLAVGDRLRAVNGDPRIGSVLSLHFFKVQPGSGYALRVARGSETLEVTLPVGRRAERLEWWRGLPRVPVAMGWGLLCLVARRRSSPSGRVFGVTAAACSLAALASALPSLDLLSPAEYAGAILITNVSPVFLALAHHAVRRLPGRPAGRLSSALGTVLYVVGGLLSVAGLVQRSTYLVTPQAVVGFATEHPGLWEARVGLTRMFGPAAMLAILGAAAARVLGERGSRREGAPLLAWLSLWASSSVLVQVAASRLGAPLAVGIGVLSDAALLLAGLAVARLLRARPGDEPPPVAAPV